MRSANFKLPHISENCEKEWKGEFFFIQGADPQFGMKAAYIDKNGPLNSDFEKELANICVEKINAMRPKPKFFVICGDLTDAFPDSEELLARKKEQEEDFFKIFTRLDKDIPLVCVCGNHDIGNHPSVSTVKRYRSLFGDDYFSFWVGGVLFLVINSQYYSDGSLVPDLVKEQEDWLDERLNEAKTSKHSAVVFQHIPPFINQPDETDTGYFALPIDARASLLHKLYLAGVRYVFCGHYHRNAGGFYKEMEVVVTSAISCQLGNDSSGVRVVKVLNDKIAHRYFGFEHIPMDLSKICFQFS